MPASPHEKSNPESWNEFEWERALRESDDYARRYFQLLDRFSELPGANQLIAAYIGRGMENGDCALDCDQCEQRWSCEMSLANEWNTASDLDWNDDEDEDGPDSVDDHDGGERQPGGAYFYESDSRFKLVRQVVLGWCNVYAAILPRESRRTGLKILFHLGRALGNLSYSIGDGMFDHPGAAVAFAKRSLDHLNRALGMLQSLVEEKPRLAPLLGAMKQHILKARGAVFDHLQECR